MSILGKIDLKIDILQENWHENWPPNVYQKTPNFNNRIASALPHCYPLKLPCLSLSLGLCWGEKLPYIQFLPRGNKLDLLALREGRKYEKVTKKIQNPPPRVGPRKYEKIAEKIQKWLFPGHFCIFSVIFSYFQGPTRGGGFCIFFVIFSYFRPWGVFVPCTSPTESQFEAHSVINNW